MGQTPTVSIGMPVYNGERFIRPALDSLLAQTHRDFELIVSDNVSTDATAEICQAYAAQDPRIRYSRLATHVSAIENFDRALGLARGEYFMWAAADDLWEPGFISTLAARLAPAPQAALAFSAFSTLNEHGAELRTYRQHFEIPSHNRRRRMKTFMLQEETLGKANLIYSLIKRGSLVAAGGFNVSGRRSWGADILLVFRLLSFGDLMLAPEVLFHKRLPAGSPTLDRDRRGGSVTETASRRWGVLTDWFGYASAYARAIDHDEHLTPADRVTLQTALFGKVLRVGARQSARRLGLPLRPLGG